MNFTDAVKTCFSKYADFTGVASRSEYWWFTLFIILAAMVTSLISDKLAAVLWVAILLPSFAVAARRLHDIDRSGWWQLISLIPLIGGLILLYWLVQPSGPNRYVGGVDTPGASV
ncbi:DUF805 domain-containing protein [Roseateles amylovorans]|uniref:DUF805 domain-containing protein n=1 Tax=Roseateles amylovorans TaxID=2978473 RepID=A0ABY6AZZ9_9BURK|nr:DUF805 domain-containing protein [Roseateles amylovorans]UXH77299.1 DUF805 domain-containing protein [Roseateles amylovorans]